MSTSLTSQTFGCPESPSTVHYRTGAVREVRIWVWVWLCGITFDCESEGWQFESRPTELATLSRVSRRVPAIPGWPDESLGLITFERSGRDAASISFASRHPKTTADAKWNIKERNWHQAKQLKISTEFSASFMEWKLLVWGLDLRYHLPCTKHLIRFYQLHTT